MGRCFVVGTGPSLEGFDFSSLEGEETIAINHAVRFFEPTYVFWGDGIQFGRCKDDLLVESIIKSSAKRYTTSQECTIPDATILKRAHAPSNNIEDGLFATVNSGLSALHLAILLKYDPIYLLGIDMFHDHEREQSHFYKDGNWIPSCVYEFNVKYFDSLYSPRYNIIMPEIYNCSPISKIKTFRFRDIREVLSG